jgi:uncharacterized membrane protein
MKIFACAFAFGMLAFVGPAQLWAREGLKKMANEKTVIGDLHPQTLRQDLQDDRSADMKRRRWIIVLAVFGMLNMGYVSLFQMGVIKHLFDPPIPLVNSDRVNSSDRAYQYGVPDGTVDLVMLALMVMLSAVGGTNRQETLWLVPIGVLVFALAQAGGAIFYFSEMVKMKVACIYCIMTALVHVSILPLTFPEAWRTLSRFVE